MNLLKKRTFNLFLSMLLVVGLGLTGCGMAQEDKDKEPGAAPGEAKVLRVIMGLSENEWEIMRNEVFPRFEEQNNVRIEAVQAEAAEVPEKLQAQIEAGRVEIDLITQDVNNLFGLVSRNLVEDLSGSKDRIPEEVIDAMIDVSTFDGKLLFMPYRPNVEIAYYNERAFNDAGLSIPKTWDELYNVAKAFKDKEGIGRVAIKANLEGDNVLHVFDFVRSAGGDPYVLNDEGSVRAFEFMQKLYPQLSPDSKTANWNFMNTFLANESVYLGQNWPFGVNVIVQEGGKEEIKAYSGWAGPVKESHALGGEVIGIPKGSPNKELALKFADFLMSKEIQEILVSRLGWPSVRTDAYGQVEEWQKPYFEAVNNALQHAEPRGNVPYWPEMEKAILGAFQDIVVNGAEVKPTLDRYSDQIKAAKGQ